jgi:hypothetical protein
MTASTERFLVPKTYAELQKLYGSHIKKLLLRCNRVDRNFEDLHSYVWVKILEARVLDRFEDHMAKQTPKVLSGLEICDLLGVSWRQWVQTIKAYHTGKRALWMPTPVNEAEFRLQGLSWFNSKTASYSYEDVIQLTWGQNIRGRLRWAFNQWGQDVKDGIIIGPTRPEGHLKIPEVRPTPSQFKNYLSTSVLNHYANFCRTLKRRHQERPQTPRGFEGDATPWEDTLEEVKEAPAELKVALSEARTLLSETIQSCLMEFGIKAGGDAEGKIFAQLQEGATLIQALKGAGLPVRVRKSVIKSIREDPDLDEEAAEKETPEE